ncbi:hypothetical protein ABPG72_001046, partial [Tetrahymena utriculariae]
MCNQNIVFTKSRIISANVEILDRIIRDVISGNFDISDEQTQNFGFWLAQWFAKFIIEYQKFTQEQMNKVAESFQSLEDQIKQSKKAYDKKRVKSELSSLRSIIELYYFKQTFPQIIPQSLAIDTYKLLLKQSLIREVNQDIDDFNKKQLDIIKQKIELYSDLSEDQLLELILREHYFSNKYNGSD